MLRLIPLEDTVVFPNMGVTLTVDVGDDERVVLVPRHENEFLVRFPTIDAPLSDNSVLAERLRELPRHLTPLEAVATEADAAARESETALDRLLNRGCRTC